ncbi:MAG: TRAP transporter large permease subunit [Alphaproteobacteria bacterium]
MSELASATSQSDGVLAHSLDAAHDWCRRLTRPIAMVGVVGMLVASVATVLDVLLRWLDNSGLGALNEIVSMSFAVAVTACIPSGLAREVNLVVDLFARWYSPRMSAWLRAFGAVCLLVFFGLLAWRLALDAERLDYYERTTVILQWPEAPFILIAAVFLAIGTAVQTVIAGKALLRAVRAPRQGRPPTGAQWVLNGTVAGVGGLLALFALVAALDFAAVSAWAAAHVGITVGITFFVLWACLLGLIPLAAVLGLTGVVGSALFLGFSPTFSAFATETTGFLTNYQVATLPLFLMMGGFAAAAGVSDDVYRLAQAVVGPIRGGLALATVGGCAGFGAVTGSSLATLATFSRVALPEMRARGYAPELSLGSIAAGGTLGALIPPSGPLIIFALLTEASIGQMFVAAIIPGLVATALYLVTIRVMVRIRPDYAPPPSARLRGELGAALRRCWTVVALFGAVIGGLYSGVFTATEAAAVGAVGAFVIAFLRGKLGRGVFWEVMAETTASTALIYSLIFGVQTFSFFVSVTGLPEMLTGFVARLDMAPIAIVALLMLVYIFLGCVMDSWAVMFITVPIVTGFITNLGYDIVWWGIVNLIVVETGMITPPFGLNLFIIKGAVPEEKLSTIFRGILPFCIVDLAKLALVILFPAIVLWLPSTMYG